MQPHGWIEAWQLTSLRYSSFSGKPSKWPLVYKKINYVTFHAVVVDSVYFHMPSISIASHLWKEMWVHIHIRFYWKENQVKTRYMWKSYITSGLTYSIWVLSWDFVGFFHFWELLLHCKQMRNIYNVLFSMLFSSLNLVIPGLLFILRSKIKHYMGEESVFNVLGETLFSLSKHVWCH